jgi:hypothetical protein
MVNDPDLYYQWSFANGVTGTGKIIYHCCNPVTVTTIYTLSLTYNSPSLCGPLPNVAVYSITLNPPPSTLCVGFTPSVSLSAFSATVWGGSAIPEIMYSFNYGDGTATSSSYTHTYSGCGNYIITVAEWDMNTPNNICYSYAAVNINCQSPTGIDENTFEASFSLSPNPVSNSLHVRFNKDPKEITVTDIAGREIQLPEFTSKNARTLSCENLAPGVYCVKIVSENGQARIIKFIKN